MSEIKQTLVHLPTDFVHKDFGSYMRVGKINVFTGLNNSGKSKLLRYLYNYRIDSLPVISFELISSTLNRRNSPVYKRIEKVFYDYHLKPNLYKTNIEDLHKSMQENEIEGIDDLISICNYIDSQDSRSANRLFLQNFLETKANNAIEKDTFLFIPLLRSTRPFNFEGGDKRKEFNTRVYDFRDNLAIRFFDDHFLESQFDNFNIIFSGLKIHEEVQKLLLGSEEDRKLIADFEKYLSDNIFYKKVSIIPKYKSDTLEIKIGDDPQLPIFNLGDGVQSVLIILFALFINKEKRMFVFIEEPETHLHPSWQSMLIDQFFHPLFSEHKFFLTSHAASIINHPQTMPFRINKVEKKTDSRDSLFYIQSLKLTNEIKESLKDLGYKASDLLQSNFVIWVEGPSDVIYIRCWLQHFGNSLIEGVDYSFAIFGGDNLKHIVINSDGNFDLKIIESMCFNYGFIIDSDKTFADKPIDNSKTVLKEKMAASGKFCWITDRREIENYIDVNIYNAYLKNNHNLVNSNTDNYHSRINVFNQNKDYPSGSIKLSGRILELVKERKDFKKTETIHAKDLREEFQRCINSSAMAERVNKIKLAKYYSSNIDPEVHGIPDEVAMKIKELINHIKDHKAFS